MLCITNDIPKDEAHAMLDKARSSRYQRIEMHKVIDRIYEGRKYPTCKECLYYLEDYNGIGRCGKGVNDGTGNPVDGINVVDDDFGCNKFVENVWKGKDNQRK